MQMEMNLETTQEENSLTNIGSEIQEYYTEEVGYDILELETGGFIFYKLFEGMFVMYEFFIPKEARSINAYQSAWAQIEKVCRDNDVKQVGGIVHLSKDNANSLIRTHIRLGASIVGAHNNTIELLREV